MCDTHCIAFTFYKMSSNLVPFAMKSMEGEDVGASLGLPSIGQMAGTVGRGSAYSGTGAGGTRSGTGTGAANSRRTTMMAGGFDLSRGEASSYSLMAGG